MPTVASPAGTARTAGCPSGRSRIRMLASSMSSAAIR